MRSDDPFIRGRAGVVELDDGSVIRVRPILADDKAALRRGLNQLSPRSRYLRFFTDVDRLSDRDLRYLTEVDYRDHFAWVAFDASAPSVELSGIGVARYIRIADEPDVAEAAVVVVDRWQRRGVGSALLSLLAQSAVENGISRFRAYLLPENAALIDLLEGQHVTVREDDAMHVLDVALPVARPSNAVMRILEQIAGLPTEP